jgi:excisionase family DNA binding protein
VPRLTFTVSESAEILGVSRTTAYELVRSGALPCVRLRRRIVITRRTLEELLDAPVPVSR